MDLRKFAEYGGPVIIQGHDVPDGDSVGSGFALLLYMKALGKEARLIYGGRAEITKPSIAALIKRLDIPLEYIKDPGSVPKDALIITTDCQYGAGNVSKFECAEFAVIDHHRVEIEEGDNTDIRPQLGSCCTLMWDHIRKAGFNVDMCAPMRDALYYGLYTDTNGLSELRHALDRDLADIKHDTGMMKALKNLALTLPELDVVSDALKSHSQIGNIGMFKAAPCDPNVLGFTSDISIQVEGVDCCVVFSPLPFGMKLSVRSGVREMMANEVAAFLAGGVGNGGGTLEKAGAFLSYDRIKEISDIEPEWYLRKKIESYLTHYDHYYAGKTSIDFSAMPLYRKLPIAVRYCKAVDVFPPKSKITARTLEGDVDIEAEEDIYLMIGVLGEVYPIKREKFQKIYNVLEGGEHKPLEYEPTLIDRVTGEKKGLLPYAMSCVSTREKLVRALRLEKPAKVFTMWDADKYYAGAVGDYLVASEGDYDDCYIARKDIFDETYEPV